MSEVAITRLSSKGQVVIPKSMRELLGMKSGEVFAMFGEGDTLILKKLQVPSKQELDELLAWGSDFARKKGITEEDVDKAVQGIRKGE